MPRALFPSLSLLALLACALASPAASARNGGLYLELAPAWGFFLTDEVIVEDGDDFSGGVGNQELYPQAGFTPTLKLGVHLFGLLGGELNVSVHGWDLGNIERGGAGYVGGVVRATPLEVLSFVLPKTLELPSLVPAGPVSWRDRPFDIGVYMGGGYTMVGEDYAYQGGYFHWGFDLKLYLTPNFAIGLDLPFRHMMYEPFRYVDYANSKGFCTDGGKAFGRNRIPVIPHPDRGVFGNLELSASEMASQCDKPAPSAVLFSPSFTISGVIDFGI